MTCAACGIASIAIQKSKLCKKCYKRAYRAGEIQPRPKRWAREWTKCKKCGTKEKRHHAKGLCVLCHDKARRAQKNAWQNRQYAANPEYREMKKRRSKEYQMAHYEEVLAKVSAWRAENPEKTREYNAKSRFRIRAIEIPLLGLVNRIGKMYQLDGEKVWNVKTATGQVIEGIPDSCFRCATS